MNINNIPVHNAATSLRCLLYLLVHILSIFGLFYDSSSKANLKTGKMWFNGEKGRGEDEVHKWNRNRTCIGAGFCDIMIWTWKGALCK